MYIANTLLPIFLIIALGYTLRRAGFFSEDFVRGLNKLMYWVGLPCLLFIKVAEARYDFAAVGRTFLVVLAGMLGSIAVAVIFCRVRKVPNAAAGAMVHGGFRGNLAYIGLPVILYSFYNVQAAQAAAMEAVAVLVLALIVPLYNIAAVITLLLARHALSGDVSGRIAKQIATNPLVLACLAGLGVSALPWPMPLGLERTANAVGQMALPLALLAIGATLVQAKLAGRRRYALGATAIKLIASPLAGLAVAWPLGLNTFEMRIALIFLCCPTAVASYVLTDQLGGDGELAATIVVVSSVLCLLPMAAVLHYCN